MNNIIEKSFYWIIFILSIPSLIFAQAWMAFVNTVIKIKIWGTSSTNEVRCDLALDGIQVYEAAPLSTEWLSFDLSLNDKHQAVLNWTTRV